MVVLSTAMEPSEDTKKIAEILNVGTTEDEFIKEAHPKIKPVTTDIQELLFVELHRIQKTLQNLLCKLLQLLLK